MSALAAPCVVLVTGASSGIGAMCAAQLARDGHRVWAASRRASAPQGCTPLAMDVDRDDSVDQAIAQLLGREGQLDAVVQCAGWGLAGAIEDCTSGEALAQFQTNFFGAHRVCRAVLPQMRTRRAGRIVLVSSLAAQVPLPYQAFYAASKAALSSYAEALRLELRPHGVDVVLVEPGNFRTGFTGSRRRSSGWTAASAYAAGSEASLRWMEQDERRAPPPDAVVADLVRAITDPRPAFRRVVVAQVFERLGAWLRTLLPWRIYEGVASRVFRVR